RRHLGCDHRDGQCDRYNPEREVPVGLDPAQVTHSMWLDRKKPPPPAASFFCLHRHVAAATNCRALLKFLTNGYCFAAEMWRHNRNCCRKRQCAPLSESNAHHCDTCATPRMSRAHGTYVASSMANAAKHAYVCCNNNKKRETPWSRL